MGTWSLPAGSGIPGTGKAQILRPEPAVGSMGAGARFPGASCQQVLPDVVGYIVGYLLPAWL